MLKLRSLVLALILVMATSLSSVMAQDKTIAEVATEAGSFTTLLAAVEAAGLTGTLADAAAGPFTVFAPTDEAFAKVPAPVIEFLLANPDVLTAVLTYHVLPAKVMSADVSTMMAATLQGEELSITVNDMGVFVDGAMVSAVDIEASNGVIHVIDDVILPTIELPAVDPIDVTGDMTAAGSSTVFPLAEKMVELFTAAGYAGNIDVASVGTGGGFERFCEAAETDISNASRAIRDEERAACEGNGRNPIEFRVGTDALSVVVSGENDFVTDVTMDELKAIFSTATNWSDVRAEWPAEPIQRFIPGTDSGTFDYFVEVVFDEDSAPILATNPQQSEDDNVLVQGIEGSPYAVGFFGYAYFAAEGDALKALSIDGVAPNAVTAEDGSYPISRPLFIYSDAAIMAEKPQVNAFVNYFLSTVNEAIEEVGYFPASKRALMLARASWLAAQ